VAASSYRLMFHLQAATQRTMLPVASATVLLRVIRELLFNVSKHARARNVWVTVARAGACLQVCVEDDGIGFHAARLARGFGPNGGFGLFSIRAQLPAIGGSFEIDSAPGRGTRVLLTVPLEEPARARAGLADEVPSGVADPAAR